MTPSDPSPLTLPDVSPEAIHLRLALLGKPLPPEARLPDLVEPVLVRHRENSRRLASHLSPPDWRIQQFLDEYLYDAGGAPRLPAETLVLDQPGLARALSLPAGHDVFDSEHLKSYRVRQGVLHNPANDRRTTQGVFHIAEGGLAIPDDKKAVPKPVFARLLARALQPPRELNLLPYTAHYPDPAESFVSLLLRPSVSPDVPGFTPAKSMEIRFFAPGGLVANLDFVESIFGNAGDPDLPSNDAGLDVLHWTGHTGCVILAPHLVRLTKKELGLPHIASASDRQRRDRMCWTEPEERYNDGTAFKVCARDERGVIVTLIADNYFGYCKKEVKTQISFAANLYGLVEEEHAGGALVFPNFDLGEEFSGKLHVQGRGHTLREVFATFADRIQIMPEGYGIDRTHPDIVYVPEDAHFDLHRQRVSWRNGDLEAAIHLAPARTYVRPSGYKVRMVKSGINRPWRLIGTGSEGTFCHKPCTVSGGGKSEISKPITDAIILGPVFVADFRRDFDHVAELFNHDYSARFLDPARHGTDRRSILSPDRSLGSVIKLLTPSESDYAPDFNAWLQRIPHHVKELAFVIKRFYRPEWGDRWREQFSVDVINGVPGNELKFGNRKLSTSYLRVGFAPDGSWRVFGLRKDFEPANKLQREDDISTSIVVPSDRIQDLNPNDPHPSVKFVVNAETRLFQRPDDAIHRGYDKQTETDLSKPGNFLSNFEPIDRAGARAIVDDAIGFSTYTEPMQSLLRTAATATDGPTYVVSSAHPRLVQGKPSANVRYLQTRPDLLNPREGYLAEMGARLYRRVPSDRPLPSPVNAVVPGRRNNPPDPATGIRSLAVFNPIHYLELPELFMEYISSMTGKSPSTTGAGSEGALTKGPFNALHPIIDLNAALVSHVLTGHPVFVTAAGWVGPRCRVDHDISLLVPEVWCRMLPEDRDPTRLIHDGLFEPCRDFQHRGRSILMSRLGYRMTAAFTRKYFGRIFNTPHLVFTDEMLRPETQDIDVFVDGMDNIIGTHHRVAESYFQDGGIELACPPLRALLHIMRDGHFEGKAAGDPAVRQLFTRDYLLQSDWYLDRLKSRQSLEQRLWMRHARAVESFLDKENYALEARRLGLRERLESAWDLYHAAKSPSRIEELRGTLGTQPLPSPPSED